MADRHADLADLAPRQRMVAVVAGLGRQVEGDRKPCLAPRQIGAVKRVGGGRRRMAGICPDQPRLVAMSSHSCAFPLILDL